MSHQRGLTKNAPISWNILQPHKLTGMKGRTEGEKCPEWLSASLQVNSLALLLGWEQLPTPCRTVVATSRDHVIGQWNWATSVMSAPVSKSPLNSQFHLRMILFNLLNSVSIRGPKVLRSSFFIYRFSNILSKEEWSIEWYENLGLLEWHVE